MQSETLGANEVALDRAATNRANAQHSTGPRTPEGKQAVRLNAVKHGFYAKTVVLPNEDRAAYEALGASLRESFRPADEKERDLVQTIQDSRWFITRANALESNLWVLVADQQRETIDARYPDENEEVRRALAEAAGFQVNFRPFDQLSRARARVKRELAQAIGEMDRIHAERKPSAQPTQVSAAEPKSGFVSHEALSALQLPELGFVSEDISEEFLHVAPEVSPQPVPAPESGFVSPIPQPAAAAPKAKMPKFSGPNGKQDRKRWLRALARKNAA